MALKWHECIKVKIQDLASDYNFRILEPGTIYFKLPDSEARVRYNPDVVWVRKRRGIHVVVWEIENDPSCKTVVGDIALAMQAREKYAEMYPKIEVRVGKRINKERRFAGIWDKRKTQQVIYPDERLLIRGDRISRLFFFLIVRKEWRKDYFNRYLDFLAVAIAVNHLAKMNEAERQLWLRELEEHQLELRAHVSDEVDMLMSKLRKAT